MNILVFETQAQAQTVLDRVNEHLKTVQYFNQKTGKPVSKGTAWDTVQESPEGMFYFISPREKYGRKFDSFVEGVPHTESQYDHSWDDE